LKDLAAAGVIPPLDPAFEESLGQTRDTMAALSVATDVLTYEVGGALAPVVTGAVLTMLKMIEVSRGLYESFGGLSGIIKALGTIYVQSLIDFFTLGISSLLKFGNAAGKLASALGMDGVGKALQEISQNALDFKNTLGERVVGAVVDNTVAGLNGMAVSITEGSKAFEGYADKVEAVTKKSDSNKSAISGQKDVLKKLAEEAARASDKLKGLALSNNPDEMDKLTKTYEAQIAEIAELAEKSKDLKAAEEARLNVTLKYEADVLKLKKEQADADASRREEAAKAAAEAEAAVAALEDLSERFSIGGVLSKGIEGMVEGIKSIGASLVEASGAGELLQAITNPAAMVALIGEAVSSDEGAKKFIKQLVQGATDLVTAIVEQAPVVLDSLIAELPSLFEAIIEGIPDLVGSLADALPDIVQMLAKAVPELLGAVIESIPAIISGLIKSIPALITGLIQGLPRLVEALIKLGPMLIGELIKTLIELLFKAIPKMVKAVFQTLKEAFIRVKNVLKDLFKEAITFGKAKTKTFNDTPKPVRVGVEGLQASFAPGDIVVAAKNEAGLRSQIGGKVSAAAPVIASLDIKDGLVFVDKAQRGLARRGVGQRVTGKKR
jgi:phage-related protein